MKPEQFCNSDVEQTGTCACEVCKKTVQCEDKSLFAHVCEDCRKTIVCQPTKECFECGCAVPSANAKVHCGECHGSGTEEEMNGHDCKVERDDYIEAQP